MNRTSAVLLLSGGLDSFVNAAMGQDRYRLAVALTCDYGQRAAPREIEAAAAIAQHFQIPHEVIALPWLGSLGASALTGDTALPEYDSCTATLDDAQRTQETAAAVWVPNRNGLFLNIAAAFAEDRAAGIVLAGFNAEEAMTFHDNSAEFAMRATRALELSTRNHPSVCSLTQSMTKTEIVAEALRRDLPLRMCWPCYTEGPRRCGRCESCARFERALAANHCELP